MVGFKPTFGRVGRSGVIPFSSSCDHVGPLTRTVADAALLLGVLEGDGQTARRREESEIGGRRPEISVAPTGRQIIARGVSPWYLSRLIVLSPEGATDRASPGVRSTAPSGCRTVGRAHPTELAVRRMLPKSKMGRNILGKLKIYKGTEHPHQAQQPKELKLS